MALTQNTWCQYGTAMSHLSKCEKETGIKMSFPLSQQQILVYIGWLLHVRSVQSDTVAKYLSGLRVASLSKGIDIQTLRSPVVNLVLAGQKHMEDIKKSTDTKPVRRAVTIPLMLILAHRLNQSPWSEYKRQLVWTVSILALFGSFRVGELLSSSASDFDSRFTLLNREVLVTGQKSIDGQ